MKKVTYRWVADSIEPEVLSGVATFTFEGHDLTLNLSSFSEAHYLHQFIEMVAGKSVESYGEFVKNSIDKLVRDFKHSI